MRFPFVKSIEKFTNAGFTLVEMLVAVLIFSLAIGAVLGIFGYTIKSQKKALASQEVLDQTSYVMEYMSRSLRMAKKSANGNCIPAHHNYKNPSGDSSIRFIDYDNQCHEFALNGTQLEEKVAKGSGKASDFPANGTPLTSSKLKINSVKFNLQGEKQPPTDTNQPRVTISLNIEKDTQRPEQQAEIKIQTTISQRNLDVKQ